jgi:hypothetical protein
MLHVRLGTFHRKPQTKPNRPEPNRKVGFISSSVWFWFLSPRSSVFGFIFGFYSVRTEQPIATEVTWHSGLQTGRLATTAREVGAAHHSPTTKGPSPLSPDSNQPTAPRPSDVAIPNPNLHLPISTRPRRSASGGGGVRDAGTQLVGTRRAARCGGASNSIAA